VTASRIILAFKALRELGPRKLGLFALYRAGLNTGYLRWITGQRSAVSGQPSVVSQPLISLPDANTVLEIIGHEGLSQLKAEADEIVAGRVRLFGGEAVPLDLVPPGELSHWSDYALGKSPFPNHPIPDIKFIWEPARFGWACTLGRAYHLTGDERYPETFWRYFEIFQQGNPLNQGPNWESAQEVALRLIAFVFATQIFADSIHSTEDRMSKIGAAIAEHANRIPQP
jgi:hypothetical protein